MFILSLKTREIREKERDWKKGLAGFVYKGKIQSSEVGGFSTKTNTKQGVEFNSTV